MLDDSHYGHRMNADPELEEWRRKFIADHNNLELEAANFGMHSVHSTMKSIGHGISHLKSRITGKKASAAAKTKSVKATKETADASDASDSSDASTSSEESDASDAESEEDVGPVKTKQTAKPKVVPEDSSDEDTSEHASKDTKTVKSVEDKPSEENNSDSEDDEHDVEEGAGIGSTMKDGLKRAKGAVGAGLTGAKSMLSEVPNHIGHGLLALASGGDEPTFDDTTDDDDDDHVEEGAGIGSTMKDGFKRGMGAVGSGLSGVGSMLSGVPSHIGHGFLALSAGGDEPVFDTHVRTLLTDKYGPGLPSSATFLNSKELLAKRREMYLQREYDAIRSGVAESYHTHDSMYTRPYDKHRYAGRYDPMTYSGMYAPADYTGQYNPAPYSGAYDAHMYAEVYDNMHYKKMPAHLPSYQRSSPHITPSPNALYGVIR